MGSADEEPQISEEEPQTIVSYLFAPFVFLLFAASAIFGSSIERVEFGAQNKRWLTYLVLTSLQIIRVLLAAAAWNWGGWVGTIVAIVLAWRILSTAAKWMTSFFG